MSLESREIEKDTLEVGAGAKKSGSVGVGVLNAVNFENRGCWV